MLASDGTYPLIVPEIKSDNAWHTITIDASTPIQNGNGNIFYGQISHLFSGFIFKMGGLDGDFMIGNIEVVVGGRAMAPLNPYEEPIAPPCDMPVVPETSEEDELPMISASPEKSEAPEASEEEETSEVPVSSEKDEAPTTSEPPSASITSETSEAPETPQEEKSGCGSVVSGVYALLSLAGAGFAMAIRKKKE